MKKYLLKFTLLPIFMLLTFSIYMYIDYATQRSKANEQYIERIESIKESIDSLTFEKEDIREQLDFEVKDYILKVAPKAESNIDMIASTMVEQSLGNNIDLCFIMAQCQIETIFGTTGMGRPQSKKSMFGIDKQYKTYEECIIHYIKNLKKHYISDKRGINDLFNNYVTFSGYRYAEDRDYERKLKKQYHSISNETEIHRLINEYNDIESRLSKKYNELKI